MIKRFASLCILILLAIATSNAAEARTKSTKKKRKGHKTYKVTKHKRKSKHYKHGSGPDIKTITSDSPYKDNSNNGVNPVETKQP